MNVYKKYCPNVFLAESDEELAKGDKITMTTKYGKENECIIWNKIFERNGKYYYSITRADGYNVQERAKQKAEKYNEWKKSAMEKADAHYDASAEAVKDIPFGQPILVGHHSENKMRRAYEQSDSHMKKCVELMHKAEAHVDKAEYWESMEGKIDLSMPESIEYYAHRLQEATRIHAGLKDGSIPREYGMQLQYAKNAVNEAQKNYDIAVKLWG